MKIVIFGANGKTGLQILKQALEKGHEVIGFIRTPGSLIMDHPRLKIAVGNLNEKLKLRDAITGADACISALGGSSLTKRSESFTNGIKSIIEVMEQEGVSRFIYLSSLGAGESRNFMPQPSRFIVADLLLRVPLADHTENEQRIANSKLNWTIIRPGGLTESTERTDLNFGAETTIIKGSPRISRTNVAAFILKQIEDSSFINKYVWLYE